MMPFLRVALCKYPLMLKALENRHNMYNETIKYICEKEQKGDILVIRPDQVLPVGRIEHNPENLRQTYDLGRKTAQKSMRRIKEFLNIKN